LKNLLIEQQQKPVVEERQFHHHYCRNKRARITRITKKQIRFPGNLKFVAQLPLAGKVNNCRQALHLWEELSVTRIFVFGRKIRALRVHRL
jgi:hypothetical protein